MGVFTYKALDSEGKKSSGVVEADSPIEARKLLRARRLFPIEVDSTNEPSTKISELWRQPARKSMSVRNLASVTRQLATLVDAGIRIDDALKTVAEQSDRRQTATLLLSLRSRVLDGLSFAAALEQYPGQFDLAYRATAKAGEESGNLGQVLNRLAEFLETRARNRQTIQLALLYPSILGFVSICIISALLVFVVPDIVRVFAARGAELPVLTSALIHLSNWLGQYGLVALLVFALLLLAIKWSMSFPAIQLGWHRWLFNTWPIKLLVRAVNVAQYLTTFSTLIGSNVPMPQALSASAEAVANQYFSTRAREMVLDIRDGQSLSLALKRTGLFSPMLVAIVASGEAGGTLSRSLSKAALQQSRDVNAISAALVALVEPLVLLIMGGVVALLVLAILMPIINLNNLI